jgi:hypothetical protein
MLFVIVRSMKDIKLLPSTPWFRQFLVPSCSRFLVLLSSLRAGALSFMEPMDASNHSLLPTRQPEPLGDCPACSGATLSEVLLCQGKGSMVTNFGRWYQRVRVTSSTYIPSLNTESPAV